MMRLRSSSRCSRKPMVGICSLAESSTGEEAAASGIGRYFRSGSRLKPRLDSGGGFRSGGCGSGLRGFSSLELLGGRWIEDAVGQRSERSLQSRQNLLPRTAAAGVAAAIEGIHFRLDLRAEFVGSAPEFVEKARNLAADLRHFLGAEKDQRQKKQEDHLAGEAKIHTSIIMRDGENRKLAKLSRAENLRELFDAQPLKGLMMATAFGIAKAMP